MVLTVIAADDALRLLLHDLLDQCRKVLVVVIEGVAVDAAGLHDILDRDVTEGALLQQLDKGLPDGPAGEICHSVSLLSVDRSVLMRSFLSRTDITSFIP